MTGWVEPDGKPVEPGPHHHYAIWDHEDAKWDPCSVDPEQSLAARIVAAVERLPPMLNGRLIDGFNPFDPEHPEKHLVSRTAVLRVIREASDDRRA